MALVFLPYVGLLWKKIPASLEEIRNAGFDGVECHLIGRLRSPEHIKEVREEAVAFGLAIRFHQGWSWETGQRNLYNVILRPLGTLVPVRMPLAEQVRDAGTDPVVVYGSLINEARQPNYIYQTASEHIHGRAYAMAFTSFMSAVKNSRLPLVFDTQHVLEWFFNKENVTDLPTDPGVIGQTVIDLWQELHPFVKEIQLCDFDPRLGPSRGRNVFIGNGVFPFAEFCAAVRASNWDGAIVPEVAPQHLRGVAQLQSLYKKVRKLF